MPRSRAAKESSVIPVNEPSLGERRVELVYLALLVQSDREELAR